MDALSAQIEGAIADARRAAVPGAIGDAVDRSGALVTASLPDVADPTTPSPSPLSVAIDGPGLFAFDSGGRGVFGRLGDLRVDRTGLLVDGRGRAILGRTLEKTKAAGGGIAPIHVARADRLTGISIDERGVVSALDGSDRVELGRIAIAIFPAPERMARADATSAFATPAAGTPRYCFPGDPNVGTLKPHALENGLVDLAGELARVWRFRRRAELAATQAYAADECERDALGLVK